MFKTIWKHKFSLVILLLIFWLVPTTISVPEQSRTETIVIAVGVDKKEEDFEVSLQYIIPHASTSSESLNLVTEKGKSVDEAIQKINKELGKFSGFAHCRVLIFSDKVAEDNLTNVLDSIIRKKTNTNNIVLISTPDSSKDVLETSNNLDSNLYTFLNNSAFSNELKGYESLKSIGDYYGCYFGRCKCLRVNIIEIEEEKQSSQGDGSGGGSETSSQNSSEGGGGGSSSGSTSKKLKNEGKILIIKNQKKLLSLSKEESENLNWFNEDIQKLDFKLNNFSNSTLENASITFHVFNKKTKYKVYFSSGVPNVDVNIKIHLKPIQILTENISPENYKINHDFLTKDVEEAIKTTILTKLKQAENNFKNNEYDVINCEDLFFKYYPNQYKNYKNSILKDRYFIKDVNFNYNIQIVKGE